MIVLGWKVINHNFLYSEIVNIAGCNIEYYTYYLIRFPHPWSNLLWVENLGCPFIMGGGICLWILRLSLLCNVHTSPLLNETSHIASCFVLPQPSGFRFITLIIFISPQFQFIQLYLQYVISIIRSGIFQYHYY